MNTKRIALSVGTLVAVVAFVTNGTSAFFSDTETSTGNTFAAGAIDLKIDNVQHYNGMICFDNGFEELGGHRWHPSDTLEWNADAEVYELVDAVDTEAELQTAIEDFVAANPSQYPQAGTDCTGSWALKDLDADRVTGDKFFNFDDVKPGDYGENTISLHVENNEAYMCAAIVNVTEADNTKTEPEAAVDPDGPVEGEATGELDEALNFVAWTDDGDNIFEPEYGEELLAGPVTADNLQDDVWALADSTVNGGATIAPGETAYIGVAWCVGDMAIESDGEIVCDGSGVGNASQTDSWGTDVQFYIVQSRNNTAFDCATFAPEIPEEEEEPVVTEGDLLAEESAGMRIKAQQGEGIYLGESDLGVSTNRVQASIGTMKDATGEYPFTLAYTSATNEISLTGPNGANLVWDVDNAPVTCTAWDALRLSVRDSRTDSGLALNNVQLNGSLLGNFGTVDVLGSTAESFWTVTGVDFLSDWTMTGDIAIEDFTGNEATRISAIVGCQA